MPTSSWTVAGVAGPFRAWSRALGVPGPVEEVDDVGFVYYGLPLSLLPMVRLSVTLSVPLCSPTSSILIVTLPAHCRDMERRVVCADAADKKLRCLSPIRHGGTPSCSVYPLAGEPWTQAEPITGVDVMAKIEDVRRHYVIDGRPVVTGLLPLGDAWACTNPTLGRGVSIGARRRRSRCAIRFGRPIRMTGRDSCTHWQRLVDDRVDGHVSDTIAYSRHRLAQLREANQDRCYRTDDPVWNLGLAVTSAAPRDPDVFRYMLGTINLLHRDSDICDQGGHRPSQRWRSPTRPRCPAPTASNSSRSAHADPPHATPDEQRSLA